MGRYHPINLLYSENFHLLFDASIINKLEKIEITLLNYLATYSFAIYFTHTLVHNGYTRRLYDLLFFHKFPYLIIPLSVVYAIIITLTTLFICMVVKWLLGKHSRILIGA
jgi:hypothetical protein